VGSLASARFSSTSFSYPERRQLTFFLSYVSLTAYWFLRFPSTFPAKEIWIILQMLYDSGFPALYLFVSRSYCGLFFSPASPAIVQPSGTKSRETLWSTIRDRISNLLRISLFFGQHRKKICRSPCCYFVYVYLSLFTNSMHDQKFQKRQPKTEKKNGTNHCLWRCSTETAIPHIRASKLNSNFLRLLIFPRTFSKTEAHMHVNDRQLM